MPRPRRKITLHLRSGLRYGESRISLICFVKLHAAFTRCFHWFLIWSMLARISNIDQIYVKCILFVEVAVAIGKFGRSGGSQYSNADTWTGMKWFFCNL